MKKIIILLMMIVIMGAFATELAAEKPRLGVLRFTNTVAGTSFWRWNNKVATDLQDMLISELFSTKAFSVLERNEIGAVLSEQDLSASGRVSSRTLVKMKKIKGAKYLIAGTVSSFEQSAGKSGKIRFKGLSLGGSKIKTYIAVDVKVIDAETGEIVDTRTIEANAKGKAIGAGLSLRNFSVGGTDAKKTPVGKAIRACIIYISKYLKCSLGKVKYPNCMKKWDKMEAKRQKKTQDSIDLDI
ncbi:MAG: CsgG/HfaB family protein [Acidobacteriota bacterium]